MDVRADLHVHSKFSEHPSEWFLRRIGAPESFMEPREIYRRCRARGMGPVTITDHNTMRGALEIADLPDTFLSVEVTTYFPEDGCKIHCLVYGLSEEQFADIQRLRENLYDLRRYLLQADLPHSIAHPLFRVNGRLTVEHVEKLLVLFNTFEGINGARHPRASELVYVIFRSLTPELLAQLADRHGLTPAGPEPHHKRFTGGSDDHSGLYLGHAYTTVPDAADAAAYLAHLRAGRHDMGGCGGTSLKLAHSVCRIAYQFYQERLVGSQAGATGILGAFLRRLAAEEESTKRRWYHAVTAATRRLLPTRRRRPRTAIEGLLMDEAARLFRAPPPPSAAPPLPGDTPSAAGEAEEAFAKACHLGHSLGYAFTHRLIESLRRGDVLESLQTAAALGPVALGLTPYVAAFATQHKDEPFLQALTERFPQAGHLRACSERKAWVTDTFSDVNGVAHTIQTLGRLAKARGRQLTVVTCLKQPPQTDYPLRNFTPVGTFRLPEYDSLEVAFPPFLDVLHFLEQGKFAEIIISTPGPLGLVALAAGRLLGLRVSGIYHTDFPQYVRCLTHDEAMEQMTWRYMHWFFGQLDPLYVPSQYYLELLADHGFERERMLVMPRGVDSVLFNPGRRQREWPAALGLPPGFTYLYVGRVSAEKNLPALLAAFHELTARGRPANLVVVGDGPALAGMKREWAHPRLVFTGYLHGEALACAYASADAFVFPSTTDTFGNAVLEAQACGLPAIVADRGGPPEIVMRQESGLVVDVDQDGALAGAMARLADEPELTTRFRERALRNAQDASWERILHGFWEGRAGTDAGSTRRAELYRIQTRWSAIPATGADAAA